MRREDTLRLFTRFAPLLLLVAGSLAAQYPVDYTVYFWPEASNAPEKRVQGLLVIERKYAIVYNVGQGPGTHSHKVLLRAYAPNGRVACEATAVVAPWSGKNTMRRAAFLEAGYWPPSAETQLGDRWPKDVGRPLPKVTPGTYQLHAYLTEIVPPGEQLQDNPNGNEWPVPAPVLIPVTMIVRPAAREIRCAAASLLIEKFPFGFQPRH
jgi:hypothetical protein